MSKRTGRVWTLPLRAVALCWLLGTSGTALGDLQRGIKNFEELMAGRKRTEQLSATEVQEVMVVLKAAQRQSAGAADGGHPSYPIEVSHDDELFIINGEKFEAKTYCFNMDEGDAVIFVDGSPHGVCTSATLLNLRTRDTCEVWCE